ncbi:FadR/GntR family transcriptional regulator [Undibacterium sp.]|jgi:DNA-binding FadR family transcriptional regulator|uniref:FadR/GntR family transcriptional regulator n=1 Tax=Undibacterium sp. TaxID=1914977 RepID=UPI002B818A9E|nr:FCD domain-containing protein [Undibacterium sp.]HTD04336.1 FCD domain-containing protein [Undibacterium sp.]
MIKNASRSSLVDAAAAAMTAEISGGNWPLGQRIPIEPKLAELLQVSRGTVREAVKMLATQGMLEVRQGSGTYVRAVADAAAGMLKAKRAGIRDQFEVRYALEVQAARLAAVRHDKKSLAHLQTLADARGSYDETDDAARAAFIARDLDFHKGLIALSGNVALSEIYQFFSASVKETIASTLKNELPEPDQAAHQRIVDAVASGNPDHAAAAMHAFMTPILDELDRLLASPTPSEPRSQPGQ